MTALQYNVSQLLKSGVGTTREYDFALDEPLDLEGIQAHDVRGRVKFTLTNFGVIAAGEADAEIDQTCARCLEPFRMPSHVTFEDEFRPTIDIATGLPARTPE